MVKHNNVIPNQHFHKDWQRYVRTWFDQPAKRKARRAARVARAKRLAPRPVSLLRPIVRGQTIRYNRKVRAGRGFSLVELKQAGINKREARGLGIAVDHRRRNRSEEGLAVNVNRLKLYKSRLLVFPRNPNSKRPKNGDSSKEELKLAKQVTHRDVLPIENKREQPAPRKITDAEREANVRGILRTALTDSKRWSIRERRARDRAEEAAGKSKKAATSTDDGAE